MSHDPATTRYEIRIRGTMSDRLLSAFPEMQARAHHRETVLSGALPDQAALHGVLGRIEALGLELLEVRRPKGGAHAAGRLDDGSGALPNDALDQPHTDSPAAGQGRVTP